MLASELAAMDLVLIDGHDAAASQRAQPLLSVLGKQLFEIGTRQ
jgi:3-hydroxyisobutyrate dehydrogenase-like beta-hydroxyacid dehydrogenase